MYERNREITEDGFILLNRFFVPLKTSFQVRVRKKRWPTIHSESAANLGAIGSALIRNSTQKLKFNKDTTLTKNLSKSFTDLRIRTENNEPNPAQIDRNRLSHDSKATGQRRGSAEVNTKANEGKRSPKPYLLPPAYARTNQDGTLKVGLLPTSQIVEEVVVSLLL